MSTTDWDDYFLGLARYVNTKSKDATKVGCVLVGPNNEIRSTGYNGFPRDVDYSASRMERPEKYYWMEHAERNAIYNAARMGTALDGCKAYVSWFTCMDCARGLVSSGVTEIVCEEEPDFQHHKYGEDFRRASDLYREVGVKVRFMKGNKQ